MPNPAAERTPTGPAATSSAQLQRQVRALLGAKNGIDESRAKRLRKQWQAHQSNAKTKPTTDADLEADAALAEWFAQLHQRVHAQIELREKQFTSVQAQLQQLRVSFKQGHVKQSQQLAQLIARQLQQIIGLSTQRRQCIAAELKSLQPEIRQLTAWRKWGTKQARENIIQEIKDIHDSGASLAEIARRIQQARQQWQTWDDSGEGGHQKLYQVFNRECRKAYKPCQAYFAQQKQQRQTAQQAREEICAALEQAYEQTEWRRPDWKEVQQRVRTHSKQWRTAGAADYHAKKPLQRRFAAIMEKFEQKLAQERSSNYKSREKLVAEMIQLEQREDFREAFAELQALSKKYLPTVTSSRSQEQALWKRFTAARDRIYQQRDRRRQDFMRTLKQNLAAKQALCAEIEAACHSGEGMKTGDGALRRRLQQWRTTWEQLGETPKVSREKVTARYRNAIQQAQKTIAQAEVAEKLQLQDQLRQKSMLCARLEAMAVAAAGDDSASIAATQLKLKSKLDTLRKKWEALPPLPAALEQPLAERYQFAVQAAQERDVAQRLRDSMPKNLARLHALLLHLEILAGLEPPAEFSKQRMALQINRLSAAMGGRDAGETHQSASAAQLIRDILLLGAVQAKQHAAIFKRVDACCAALAALPPANPSKPKPTETEHQ